MHFNSNHTSTLLWTTLRKWKILRVFVCPHSPMQPAAPGCWAMTGHISLTHTHIDERTAQKMCRGTNSVQKERTDTTGLIGAWLALFRWWPCDLRWMHLWLPSAVRLCLTDVDRFVCHWPRSFSHWLGNEKKEDMEESRENISFHPSCPFRGRENLTWLTWTHLASLANRKCPLQLFFGRGGGVPACTVMDKCYRSCLPLIFDLKTKIDITNVLWYLPNWLDIP